MKILCFGSLNLDYTYQVDHMVRPSETLMSNSLETFCGGKGLNQAVAVARAGMPVAMAGCIGPDGQMLKTVLQAFGVDTALVETLPNVRTGHAIIQTDPSGENCILLYGGANVCIPSSCIAHALEGCDKNDILIIQNEINNLDLLMRGAHEKGMRIFYTPAPMSKAVRDLPLETVDTLLCNKIEACMLTGENSDLCSDFETLLVRLKEILPGINIVMTLGSKGALYQSCQPGSAAIFQPAFSVKSVDTTAAGDTFAGYLIASLSQQFPVQQAMELASAAAALSTTRMGAAASIPTMQEVADFLEKEKESEAVH